MADNESEGTWLTLENFPRDLKARFRSATGRRSTTMRQTAIDLIEGYCAEFDAEQRAVLTEVPERGAGHGG